MGAGRRSFSCAASEIHVAKYYCIWPELTDHLQEESKAEFY
jgi:hypothetical protein